jgi:hypothetical protein
LYFGASNQQNLKPNEDFELNPVLNSKVEEIGEVVLVGNSKKRIEGVTSIDPVIIRKIPGANAGIENIIKKIDFKDSLLQADSRSSEDRYCLLPKTS